MKAGDSTLSIKLQAQHSLFCTTPWGERDAPQYVGVDGSLPFFGEPIFRVGIHSQMQSHCETFRKMHQEEYNHFEGGRGGGKEGCAIYASQRVCFVDFFFFFFALLALSPFCVPLCYFFFAKDGRFFSAHHEAPFIFEVFFFLYWSFL